MGRPAPSGLWPRGGGNRRVGRIGVEAVRPGDRVVVSMIRSCGGCFFCQRGEPYLCDAEFPIDTDGRLHTTDGEHVRAEFDTVAFAQQLVVHASQLATVPDFMPLDVASLLACGVITGFGAVVATAQVPVGSSVVVIGTGGVGLNSVQAHVSRGHSRSSRSISRMHRWRPLPPSVLPTRSTRPRATPWRRCVRSPKGGALTTSSSQSAPRWRSSRTRPPPQGRHARRRRDAGLGRHVRRNRGRLRLGRDANPREPHGLHEARDRGADTHRPVPKWPVEARRADHCAVPRSKRSTKRSPQWAMARRCATSSSSTPSDDPQRRHVQRLAALDSLVLGLARASEIGSNRAVNKGVDDQHALSWEPDPCTAAIPVIDCPRTYAGLTKRPAD